MATTSVHSGSPAIPIYRRLWPAVREVLSKLGVTGLGLLMLGVFLLPLGYVLATSLKLDSQLTTPGAPLWPGRGRSRLPARQRDRRDQRET